MVRARSSVLTPLTVVVLCATTVALDQSSAVAGTTSGPSQDEIDSAAAEVRSLDQSIAGSHSQLQQVRDELARLDVELAEANRATVAADERADEAAREAEAARVTVERTRAELLAARVDLSESRRQLDDVARDTYMHGGESSSPMLAVVARLAAGGTTAEIPDVMHFAQVVVEDRSGVVDETVRLVERIRTLTRRAEVAEQARAAELVEAAEAQEVAARRHAGVLRLIDRADTAMREEEQLLAALRQDRDDAGRRLDRLETAAREAAAREEAARQEAARQEAARQEAARQEAARREAAARTEQERSAAPDDPTPTSSPSVDTHVHVEEPAPAPEPPPPPPPPSVSWVDGGGGLATVGGITVAASLAPALHSLLEDARADGIVFGGYGYRSPESTARLRVINGCPDVYTSPASSCRVPTARPGTSMHEQGLAVDFTYAGRTICYPRSAWNCHGNAGFDWLRANAGRYGLYVLGSEAWHWSVNGR